MHGSFSRMLQHTQNTLTIKITVIDKHERKHSEFCSQNINKTLFVSFDLALWQRIRDRKDKISMRQTR